MAFKTEAIVLHHRPLREADRLYYVLTPHEGRLKVMVRSASKTSSKLAGHLEPFQRVRLMIGRGAFDHVAGVDILESWSQFRQDIPVYALACCLAEAILLLNPPGTSTVVEYQIAIEVLRRLNRVDLDHSAKEQTIYHALWRLLAMAGWKFDFSHCQICDTVTHDWWYTPGRGFVCSQHEERNSLLATPLVNFFLQAQDGSQQLALLTTATPQLREITQAFFQDTTGRNLQSLITYYQL